MITVSPNQADTQKAIGLFLEDILPSNTDVVVGQINRVPEPKGANYVIMWTINRNRLETNIDGMEDVLFTASIAADVMTVSAIEYGVLLDGNSVFGITVADGTSIVDQLTGDPGGVGTYTITPDQTVTPRSMAAGYVDITQNTEVVMQLDVHGPLSSDNAQTISTLFRDTYGVDKFHEINPDITPLFTSDPRQIPFSNAEQQVETRWIIDAHLQVNARVIVPQQFAETVEVDVINVETL